MTSRNLQNIMRLQARLERSGRTEPRFGTVSSFHPASYCAKVRLQPGGEETGWIPVGTHWAGDGWGAFAPPPVGAQVIVLFQEGSIDVGCIVSVLYNKDATPLSVDAGEYWLVHEDGAYLKLKSGGKLLLHTAVELDAGDMNSTLYTLVTSAFQSVYNGHTHKVIGGVAQPTDATLTAAHLTGILKAN